MKKILIYTLSALFFFSCGKKADNENEAAEAAGANLIEITSEQFETSGMMLGEVSLQSFTDEITCKGFLTAPADGTAKISSPIAGKVESFRVKIGDYVRQGEVVCTISGSDFLDLQQQFAEAAAHYQQAKLDYERVKALRAENIGAEKELKATETVYKTALVTYNALKARIQALRLNPSQIESGEIYTSFPVVAPISGHITTTGAVIGQYVEMQNELAEVVNVNSLQLQLSVFERNLMRLKVGQKVLFNVCGRWSQSVEATLITVGKTINPESRAIECIAKIGDVDKSRLVNHSYAEAKIMVDNFEIEALPVSAFQKEEDKYFVFVLEKKEGDKYYLKKTKVEVGNMNNSFIEVLEGLPEGKEVVIRGIEML